MRPRERRETGEQDLFRSRLDQIIDMKHALVKLARAIDWGFWSRRLGWSTSTSRASRHCGKGGVVRPPIPISRVIQRMSANVDDARLGRRLGWRFRLCRKLKHRCLLTLMQVRQEI